MSSSNLSAQQNIIAETLVCIEGVPALRRVAQSPTGIQTIQFIGNDGLAITPTPTAWVPGPCMALCSSETAPQSGPALVSSISPLGSPNDNNAGTNWEYDQVLWDGGALRIGASPGSGGQNFLHGTRAIIYAPTPSCTDGTATITANIRHRSVLGGHGFDASFGMIDLDTGSNLDIEAVANENPGSIRNWTLTATVPVSKIVNGRIVVQVFNDTYHNGSRASDYSNFSCTVVFNGDCTYEESQAIVVKVCNFPPEPEFIRLCDNNGMFLRIILYSDSGDPVIVDRELDGQTPYSPSGTVRNCSEDQVTLFPRIKELTGAVDWTPADVTASHDLISLEYLVLSSSPTSLADVGGTLINDLPVGYRSRWEANDQNIETAPTRIFADTGRVIVTWMER